ncbi:MAG: ATP-grasp domain-containing protein [Euryarchaeota archaeon]|nr:ATP-grasp domain-containing protein [Euryarchaeota archaeon]
MQKIESVLVIGVNTRPIVCSAKKLGLKVFAADFFDCLDLRECADSLSSIAHQAENKLTEPISKKFDPKKLLMLSEKFYGKVDGALLTSGLDFSKIKLPIPIFGNEPSKVHKLSNKSWLLKKLKQLSVPTPTTEIVSGSQEAKEVAKNFGYPVVIKPIFGAGGKGVRLVKSPADFQKFNENMLIQEFIDGIPASASLLSTGKDSIIITINEQLLGLSELGRTDFQYCGNVVPLITRFENEIKTISKKITKSLKLVGSNGIDFVLTREGPIVMEVNPRFQGSFECIEAVTGMNLVKAHLEALRGILPEKVGCRGYAVRMTAFAKFRSKVVRDFRAYKGIRDIPLKGSIIDQREPVATVFVKGSTRINVLKRAKKLVRRIYQALSYV